MCKKIIATILMSASLGAHALDQIGDIDIDGQKDDVLSVKGDSVKVWYNVWSNSKYVEDYSSRFAGINVIGLGEIWGGIDGSMIIGIDKNNGAIMAHTPLFDEISDYTNGWGWGTGCSLPTQIFEPLMVYPSSQAERNIITDNGALYPSDPHTTIVVRDKQNGSYAKLIVNMQRSHMWTNSSKAGTQHQNCNLAIGL